LVQQAVEPALAPEFSDDALALEFTRRHGDDLRYVAPWGKWLRFDGRRWAEDRIISVFDLAREVCRDSAKQADEKIERQITSAKTIAAVEKVARSDPRHATLPEQLDADPYLFNTPGGTVDLRTGELRPHRREDLITKLAGATPNDDADDRAWIKFLMDITCGDSRLRIICNAYSATPSAPMSATTCSCSSTGPGRTARAP
jgi:putative DNA primase/helicase